jgi:hypothetical protein
VTSARKTIYPAHPSPVFDTGTPITNIFLTQITDIQYLTFFIKNVSKTGLSELTPGKWTLYLVRKKLTKSVANGYQTSGIMEYYTRSVEVTVTG